MSWRDEMLNAMSTMVSERIGRKVKIARYEDTTHSDGYCETCYHEWQAVDFYDDKGELLYSYYGTMSEFMEELTR